MDSISETIIIGAGPTGLLLANLLGSRGIVTTVLEKELPPGDRDIEGGHSRAIGVTPPSLEILDKVGLADHLVRRGLPISGAVVHSRPLDRERSPLGELDFQDVHERFPFILSVPQHVTRDVLENGAARFPSLTIHYGREVVACHEDPQNGDGPVTVHCADGSAWRARFCVAADGAHGRTGDTAGIRKRGAFYRPRFHMGDYRDGSGLGDTAHLWFTREGAVESFPLPGTQRRWIVQLRDREDAADLERILRRRAGFCPDREDKLRESAFQPSRSEAETFHRGKLFLLGDAAHTMSPIGGQGMNTGFGDADLLADTLHGLLRPEEPGDPDRRGPDPGDYVRLRRRASRKATRRAAAGMWVGTRQGVILSAVRDALVRILMRSPLRRTLARHFAMIATAKTTSGAPPR
ncbi:MAG: FAD-dependent monooxygenase [Spirochaetaceae bacterium]|nr:MAG: FAD-dependent monooxygenase [Spirochaetaceae bacterium]